MSAHLDAGFKGFTATYERPVGARLIVRLDNGDEWDASQVDLDKFTLVPRLTAYMAVHDALVAAGMTEPGGKHSSLRYLIERTLAYVDMPMEPDNEEDGPVIETVRRNLAQWEDEDR